MKILIIALSGIGDALMFTPAISVLNKHLPDARLDALVMFRGVKDIYTRLPEISKIHHHDFLNRNPLSALYFILKLRKKYDLTVNIYPSNRKEYNLISFMIGGKRRLGISYLRKNNRNFGFLNNRYIKENDSLHNVEENLKLAELILSKEIVERPPLYFPLIESDKDYAAERLNSLDLKKGSLLIGFHPGCSTLKNHTKRRWEPDKFAELGKRILNDYDARILIFGGPEENDLKKEIEVKINSQNASAVNTNSLAETAAIMEKCDLFVSNDSSLMHVAAALQLKTIAILGPTNKNYIHPWKTEHKIVSLNLDCSPCFYYSPKPLTCTRKDVKFKCIKELGVDMVYDAVKGFIGK